MSSSSLATAIDDLIDRIRVKIAELADPRGSSLVAIKRACEATPDEAPFIRAALARGTQDGTFTRSGNKWKVAVPDAPEVVAHVSLEQQLQEGANNAIDVDVIPAPPPPPPPPPQDEQLTIILREQGGDTYPHFRIHYATELSIVFRAYARRRGVDLTSLHFVINGEHIHESDTPRSLELEDGDRIDAFMEQTGDIGIFGTHINSVGIEHLTQKNTTITAKFASKLIHHLHANPDATFVNEKKQVLNVVQRITLVKLLDEKWNGKDQDFKLTLTNKALSNIIGNVSYDCLALLMDGTHDIILLRRCIEHGNVIKFHTDKSYKTLQVPLNDESEYTGGRLIYVTKDGAFVPSRDAGSYTKHANDIAHGVTRLESGVRYGLFLLQKKKNNN